MGARYAALGILEASGDKLANFVASGLTAEEIDAIGPLPTGRGILGVLIRDPRPLRLECLKDHPASVGLPAKHPPMKSFLGVPVVGRNGPIGNLYLADKVDGGPAFTEEDEAIAIMLASHAAVAVENARLHDEQERLVVELQSMQRARDRFFATVNHELRNAITAVFGWAELWLRKAGSDSPRAAIEVYESAERAVNLLEDLLDLSRLDESRLNLVVQHADARAIIREAVHSVEPAADACQVVIEVSTAHAELPCQTDPQRVRQVLINLLRNAIRHSPKAGTVTLELHRNGEDMRFAVVDSGPGIAAAHLSTVFDAYERAGQESERGTGLGLTLSRQIARLLGGDLRAESDPGQGARFILELPIASHEAV
jgi:signal transduction histidine kinase